MAQEETPRNIMVVNGKMWAIAVTRKKHACSICKSDFDTGTRMFRPMGNPLWRSHRICSNCAMERKLRINNKYAELAARNHKR